MKEYPPPQMWLGFVHWALGEEGFRQRFKEATGIGAPFPAKSASDMMIDGATGYKLDYIKKFVVWVTETHWGEECAPKIYFEKFKGEGDW